uniref:Uncharacterized protein n=1 Tax=Arundo donax TaxID=35708 RepID=A0A0A9AXU1_ARUDO
MFATLSENNRTMNHSCIYMAQQSSTYAQDNKTVQNNRILSSIMPLVHKLEFNT